MGVFFLLMIPVCLFLGAIAHPIFFGAVLIDFVLWTLSGPFRGLAELRAEEAQCRRELEAEGVLPRPEVIDAGCYVVREEPSPRIVETKPEFQPVMPQIKFGKPEAIGAVIVGSLLAWGIATKHTRDAPYPAPDLSPTEVYSAAGEYNPLARDAELDREEAAANAAEAATAEQATKPRKRVRKARRAAAVAVPGDDADLDEWIDHVTAEAEEVAPNPYN